AGMGATLVAPVFIRDRLFWISIGDSPLYLYRGGELRQLNEDHSLGPHIDYMVRSGMMSEDVGRNHPDRNALTSVLIGETIERIDCPSVPFQMNHGDILVVASDGLQFLSNRRIRKVLRDNNKATATKISETLLEELGALDDPEQDNICFSVIKVDFHGQHDENANIFTPEFENRAAKPRQVRTRPIKPHRAPEADEIPPVAAPSDEPPPPPTASPTPASSHTPTASEGAPIFLRRRWLATDGGA
ncbi:MAG: PP2C family protein-serine/threonine phosphatase, partial [Boseongicola sp.]